MEVFGFMGMSLGAMGFIFGIICLQKIEKLTAALKEKGVLEETFKAD